VSWNAAVGLSMLGSTDCLPLIHAGLQRADSWQRWEAINALGRVHDDTSVATILAALPALVDRDRNEAALALGMIGGDAALDALIGLLRDPEPSVRWRAAMGLGQARDVRGIAPLEALLVTETDPLVTEHARRALDGLRAAVPSPRP
jgi:HEAT repeat protein